MSKKKTQQNGTPIQGGGVRYVFKKGQIIPKRIGSRFLDVPKKARHFVVFGCDVTVEVAGDVCRAMAESAGPLIRLAHIPSIRRNNGTRQKVVARISNWHLIGAGSGCAMGQA
jgi:hypothetical protein